MPEHPLPLFAITLRQAGKTDQITLSADKGWTEVAISTGDAAPLEVVAADQRRVARTAGSQRSRYTAA